jgi:hypothetical protein
MSYNILEALRFWSFEANKLDPVRVIKFRVTLYLALETIGFSSGFYRAQEWPSLLLVVKKRASFVDGLTDFELLCQML